MVETSPEHEVDSVDEAIAVGAVELGIPEDELREQVEAISFQGEPRKERN